MPQREILWSEGAVVQLEKLLGRRTDKKGVLRCIEWHVLGVANDVTTATLRPGPQAYRSTWFTCKDKDKDGDVSLWWNGVFEVLSEESVIVIDIRPTEF